MKLDKFYIPIAIIISGILISAAVLVIGGFDFSRSPITNKEVGDSGVPSRQAEAPSGPQKVSVDDDPVLGDDNAPITIIEFSDYECPFCRKVFGSVYPKLKEEYIDKGLLKLVFRDLPLPFHDPLATREAIAANCAREQGGDEAYFSYHDEIFVRTDSNGKGLDDPEDLHKIAADLNLNTEDFESCLESDRYKDEVAKDIEDANSAGATGTPTFFIGKSSDDGLIEGEKIVGAQPYSVFKSVIDRLLSE